MNKKGKKLSMDTHRVSITSAKQNLGELVKRAAYGGERFLLQFRGKPQAALVSYADFERLQALEGSTVSQAQLLKRLRSLRQRIATRTGEAFNSAREIGEVREERLDRLAGLS